MTIYEELIKRVSEGESFYVNFKNRALKIGKKFIIADGVYDKNRDLIVFEDYENGFEYIMKTIYQLYLGYKYSLPSERSENKRRKYFKALSVDNLTDNELFCAERREIAQAKLEGFILCVILTGQFKWNEERLGRWFWQSKGDPDLVILRSWVENN